MNSHEMSRIFRYLASPRCRTSPTPLSVKLCSVLCIYMAHSSAGQWFQQHWESVVFYQGFLEAAAFQILSPGGIDRTKYVGYLVARTLLWKGLVAHQGALSQHNTSITAGLMALIAFNSTRAQPIGPVISMGMESRRVERSTVAVESSTE